jgi:hypothetical protein
MNKIKNLVFILIIATGLSVCAQQIPARTTLTSNLQQSTQQAYSSVSPLDLVARPSFYLNKNVKIKAKFDKFSTLGLDYQPAMKSSEKYISFLIQRPDVTDHNIPLSELKLFLDRTEAEKYIELNSGDIIEFSGKVFSTALGDPWVEVTNFNVISTKSKTETK